MRSARWKNSTYSAPSNPYLLLVAVMYVVFERRGQPNDIKAFQIVMALGLRYSIIQNVDSLLHKAY